MAKDHRLPLSEKPFSLLQANELFVNKILSRNSSFGRSARLPACRLPGQIPFNWEAEPGLPKDRPSEILPPADLPPPAVSGDGLVKTPLTIPKQEPVKTWFWKKPKRKVVVKKNGAFGSSVSRRHVVDSESEVCRKSNDESFSSSSCISYSLSSSSSASSSNGYGRRRSKLGRLAKGFMRENYIVNDNCCGYIMENKHLHWYEARRAYATVLYQCEDSFSSIEYLVDNLSVLSVQCLWELA